MSEPTMHLRIARTASKVGPRGGSTGFPYRDPTVCYVVQRLGEEEPLQFAQKRGDVLLALNSAHLGEVALYAVWPGKFSSDMFLIDDHEAMARAFDHTLPEGEKN